MSSKSITRLAMQKHDFEMRLDETLNARTSWYVHMHWTLNLQYRCVVCHKAKDYVENVVKNAALLNRKFEKCHDKVTLTAPAQAGTAFQCSYSCWSSNGQQCSPQ